LPPPEGALSPVAVTGSADRLRSGVEQRVQRAGDVLVDVDVDGAHAARVVLALELVLGAARPHEVAVGFGGVAGAGGGVRLPFVGTDWRRVRRVRARLAVVVLETEVHFVRTVWHRVMLVAQVVGVTVVVPQTVHLKIKTKIR
jgi:hypothetical protein